MQLACMHFAGVRVYARGRNVGWQTRQTDCCCSRLYSARTLKMSHACAHSSAVFGIRTLPPRVLNQSVKPCRTHKRSVVRAATGGDLFFVAHNVFKVKKEGCQQFEDIWKNRESFLKESPGFVRFALLRGDEEGDYISQTTWASRQDFKNWTQSQSFSKAHGKTDGAEGEKPKESKRTGMAELLDGPPNPRMYEAVTVTEL